MNFLILLCLFLFELPNTNAMFGIIFYNNYFNLVRSYITLVTFCKINCYNKGINITEHTFSTLYRLKNHLQSTMTQE